MKQKCIMNWAVNIYVNAVKHKLYKLSFPYFPINGNPFDM